MSCTLMDACVSLGPVLSCRTHVQRLSFSVLIKYQQRGCLRPPLSVCTIFGSPLSPCFRMSPCPLLCLSWRAKAPTLLPYFHSPVPFPSVVSPLLAGCQLRSLSSPAWVSVAAVPASKCANQTEACRATLASAPCPSLPGLWTVSILPRTCPSLYSAQDAHVHEATFLPTSLPLTRRPQQCLVPFTPRPYAACIYSPPSRLQSFQRPSVNPPLACIFGPVRCPSPAVPPRQSVSLWHCGRFSRSTASSSHPMPLPSRLRQFSPTHARKPSASALAPCT